MRRRLLFGLALLTLITGQYRGATKPAAAVGTEAGPRTVRIATATPSGVYYLMGQAIARLWNQQLTGVTASVVTTGGTPENIDLLDRREAEVAFAQDGVVYYALRGMGPFQGRAAGAGLRGLTHFYPNVMQVMVRKKAGIRSLTDLQGTAGSGGAQGTGGPQAGQGLQRRRIVLGPPNSATEINSREILGVHNIDLNTRTDLISESMGYGEAADALAAGRADVAVIAGGLPTPAVASGLESGEVQLIGLEEKKIAALIRRSPWYYPYVIPKGTYPGQAEDIRTVAVSNILVARADLPDELVYQMVKALYENRERLASVHPAARDLEPREALQGITGVVELHPGAARYLSEIGVLR